MIQKDPRTRIGWKYAYHAATCLLAVLGLLAAVGGWYVQHYCEQFNAEAAKNWSDALVYWYFVMAAFGVYFIFVIVLWFMGLWVRPKRLTRAYRLYGYDVEDLDPFILQREGFRLAQDAGKQTAAVYRNVDKAVNDLRDSALPDR